MVSQYVWLEICCQMIHINSPFKQNQWLMQLFWLFDLHNNLVIVVVYWQLKRGECYEKTVQETIFIMLEVNLGYPLE